MKKRRNASQYIYEPLQSTLALVSRLKTKKILLKKLVHLFSLNHKCWVKFTSSNGSKRFLHYAPILHALFSRTDFQSLQINTAKRKQRMFSP